MCKPWLGLAAEDVCCIIQMGVNWIIEPISTAQEVIVHTAAQISSPCTKNVNVCWFTKTLVYHSLCEAFLSTMPHLHRRWEEPCVKCQNCMKPDWDACAYRLRIYLILGYVVIIPVLYTTIATPQNHMKAQRPCCFRLCSGKGGLNRRVMASPVAWRDYQVTFEWQREGLSWTFGSFHFGTQGCCELFRHFSDRA